MDNQLPVHDDFSLFRRAFSASAIAVATTMLAGIIYRIIVAPVSLEWSVLPLAIAGMIAADFVSGIVHWMADTWGSETMPLVGRRILHPFRVHHVESERLSPQAVH